MITIIQEIEKFTQEILKRRLEKRRKDLPRINALRASARAKLTPEEIAACDLEGDIVESRDLGDY